MSLTQTFALSFEEINSLNELPIEKHSLVLFHSPISQQSIKLMEDLRNEEINSGSLERLYLIDVDKNPRPAVNLHIRALPTLMVVYTPKYSDPGSSCSHTGYSHKGYIEHFIEQYLLNDCIEGW